MNFTLLLSLLCMGFAQAIMKRYGLDARVAGSMARWKGGPPVPRRIDGGNEWPLILASSFSYMVKMNLK